MRNIWNYMHRTYLFEQEELVPDNFIKKVLPLLPEERRKKALRYHNRVDRNNCVLTYLILKIALKDCFQIKDFTVQYGRYGKPFLKEYPNIFFSISHCKCGCVVAVADELVGIDIQNIIPFSWDVAERVCCLEELGVLKQSTHKDREFIRMWTMKESFLKMTGEGIFGDLKSINTLEMDWIEVEERESNIIAICSQAK